MTLLYFSKFLAEDGSHVHRQCTSISFHFFRKEHAIRKMGRKRAGEDSGSFMGDFTNVHTGSDIVHKAVDQFPARCQNVFI